MLYRELLTPTIASHGDVLGHKPISEAKIIPEFLPRKIRAIKAVEYSAKPCPIPCFPMEAVFLLASCLVLPTKEFGELNNPFTKSRR